MPPAVNFPPPSLSESATPPGRFPAGVLPKYPHLSREDSRLADAFWPVQTLGITRVDYDVRVGEGLPVGFAVPAYLSSDWRELTKLRIDAVGYGSGIIWIIEFKPRVNLGLVGQLVSYGQLYRSQFVPRLPVQLVAVVERTSPDLDPVLVANNILTVVVTPV